MTAAEIVWAVAGERETAPTTLRGLPERVQGWVLGWLDTPRTSCEHPVNVRYSALGATRELCGVCATRARLDRVGAYCGRCAAPLAGDEYALRGIFAVARHLIVVIAVCDACMTEPERTEP